MPDKRGEILFVVLAVVLAALCVGLMTMEKPNGHRIQSTILSNREIHRHDVLVGRLVSFDRDCSDNNDRYMTLDCSGRLLRIWIVGTPAYGAYDSTVITLPETGNMLDLEGKLVAVSLQRVSDDTIVAAKIQYRGE